jgi:hypothetical protein
MTTGGDSRTARAPSRDVSGERVAARRVLRPRSRDAATYVNGNTAFGVWNVVIDWNSALVAHGARGDRSRPAAPWSSDLFVDTDGALEHRAGVVAFVSDCFEHPGGQRIELALNRVVSSQLGVLQQCDEQECGGGQRGSGCLLVGSAGTKGVPSEPREHEREAGREEGRRAREVRCALGEFVKAAATVCFTASDGML